ncbi:polyamine ABC transporter ATP-binding protein [Acuticoccus sediminis]|uniref:Polyamine ABC transporter ATP-binding protein n=1 Tax=Acuticoccus sediminis TaxID=2184697 RepID=A0A8B2NYD6_9HYPH|nr:ABC transporter ATP-binding protein [Acuticoccus sediminis]RAI00808.1 polyamine ABC transporter ATP-binding protein [Acuticoccus sediminis]
MTDRTTTGAAISIQSLRKVFDSTVAVDDVSLDIEAGEFVALLGPSGSGKSTVLTSIAGFEFPSAGRIDIGGVDCTRVPPFRRNIGMVFQHYTLFPHLSVIDNVAFPLKMRRVPLRERRRRAAEALATVRLDGYGERMPGQLSGGQQQRVALARAIVYQPRVLLMDEPLSALDKNLREEMQLEIKRLHHQLGMTVVFVTHDQGEALTMADRVAILRDGRVQQVAPARELYERPANLFAAGFIGEMNFIPVTYEAGAVSLPGGARWALPADACVAPVAPGPATLAIRPERLSPTAVEGGERTLEARVEEVVYAGAGTLVIARLPDGTEVRARMASATIGAIEEGQPITLHAPENALLVYPRDDAE